MRRTIIGAILFGLVASAYAEPRWGDRDRRTDEAFSERNTEQGWTRLGRMDLDRNGQRLMVGADAGRFHVLRIESSSGAPLIRRVNVRFVDNSVQTLNVDKRVRQGEPLDLQLDGNRSISSITVDGRPDGRSAFIVTAR
jgi:hypothetical protein